MQICCAGEVMVELAAENNGGLYRRGVAGDSYNTAIYLSRAGLQVSYLTRLGDDALSDDIIAHLTAEGIGDRLIKRVANYRPGLYLIDNDPQGERHFHYWRDHAPARELFAQPLHLPDIDVFYFTGITLAVTRAGLEHVLALLGELRAQGCRIVFDPNYRPALWDNIQQARQHCAAVLPLCDTVLPTLSDDMALWDIRTVEASRAHYQRYGASELVIKGADLVAHAFTAAEHMEQQAPAVEALDTTGAGDAFNAAYLAARLQGGSLRDALTRAQQLSAAVVQHRGAILPRVENTAERLRS
jgi:2-dehydro-3-deoxygluconokinase